jgi:zinc transport system substrate-binding protein
MTKNVVAQSTPIIVVSIKPIHSIVTKIMDGVTKPELLLDANNSAHTFHLKPSQIKMISNADLVIVISENFELGLRKALKNINEDSHLKISELDQLIIHNSRGEEIYNKNEGSNKFDFHLWLDVNNMQLIATYISNIIIELDPKNEHIYAENLKIVNLELDELKEQLKQQLAPFSSIPFAIYSDTLQYFEKSLELQRPVIITPFHGAGLSIKRTLDAKRKIKDLNISCLIYDTEVKAKQLRVLSEGLNLKSFKIDILGNEFAPGPDQYFNLMKKTSSQLALCLK